MILNPWQVKGLLRIHFQDTIESCSSSELEQSIQLRSTDLWPPKPPVETQFLPLTSICNCCSNFPCWRLVENVTCFSKATTTEWKIFGEWANRNRLGHSNLLQIWPFWEKYSVNCQFLSSLSSSPSLLLKCSVFSVSISCFSIYSSYWYMKLSETDIHPNLRESKNIPTSHFLQCLSDRLWHKTNIKKLSTAYVSTL